MTQEKLEQIYYLNKELEMWRQRRKDLHLSVATSTRKLDGMPFSKTNSVKKPVEDAVLRISTDLERIDKRIARQIMRIEKATSEIERFIMTIEKPLIRLIVEYRCVQNLTWKEIGKRVDYDPSGCRKKYLIFLRNLPKAKK